MAGLAAPGALTDRPVPAGDRFQVRLATGQDDPEIRALLRGQSFDGAVRVSLEREPDARLAGEIEGDTHQILVARDRINGRLAGIGSRSVRTACLNGTPVPLGYLGLLRLAPDYRRHRQLLECGFTACRRLHDDDPVACYAASVVSDNARALRLLTRMPARTAPRFSVLGPLATLVMPVTRRSCAAPDDVRLERADDRHVDDLAACLQRHARRHQLAPWWTSSDLRSPRRCRDLRLDDFTIAIRHDRIVGVVAVWDQRRFKQVVVRSYEAGLARWRRLLNLAAPFTGLPRFPAVGARLNFAFLSHLAVDDDREDVSLALVDAAMRRAPADVDHVVTGLSPFTTMFETVSRRYRHRRYDSTILAASWPDGDAVRLSIDGRPLHPEAALL